MQLQPIQVEVTRGNMGASTAFGFEIGAKAFRVMSNDIYQDKMGSMVREVSCNAYDSHVQAGKADVPFSIHLPDVYEPWFSVRDYGIGLDDDQARTVLTSYFKSTKDNNNDVVGAFGLGSKTPFAYCNAFTVTAIKDGIKRNYSCFVGDAGVPDMAIMGEPVATDECNGVEIRVPVEKEADFQKFPQVVRTQLTFFDVKPEILNSATGINWLDWKGSMSNYMECENIFIGSANSPLHGIWAVQGVVGYPLNVAMVADKLTLKNREFLDVIKNRALIRFDIGDIEVTASREGISYSDYTLRSIESRLDAARIAISGILESKLGEYATPWAKACEINSNLTFCNLAKACGVSFEAPYYTGGAAYTNGQYTIDAKALSYFNAVVATTTDDEDEDDAPVGQKANVVFRRWSYSRRSRRSHVYKWTAGDFVSHIKPAADTIFIVRNTSNKPLIRLREFMDNLSGSPEIFVIEATGMDTPESMDDAVIATLTERLNGPEILKLSDMALPTAAQRAKRDDYRQPKAYLFEDGDDFTNTSQWTREHEPLKDLDGGYYVVVERHNIQTWADGVPQHSRHGFRFATAGLLDKPIYAVRARDVVKLKSNPLWKPLGEIEAEMIAAWRSDKTLCNAHAILNCVPDSSPFEFMDNRVLAKLRDAFDAGLLTDGRKSSLAKLFRMERVLVKLLTRARRSGLTDIITNAIESGYCSTAATVRDAIANRIKSVENGLKAEFPFLSMVKAEYMPNSDGRSNYGVSDAMASHLVDYCNAFAGKTSA